VLKLVSIGLAAAAGMVAAADAAMFVEKFDGESIRPSRDVYESYGQFVTSAGAGIEIQGLDTVTKSHNGGDTGHHGELGSHGSGSNSSMSAVVNFVAGRTYDLTVAHRPRTNNDNDNDISLSVGSLTGTDFSMSQWVGVDDGAANEQSGWHIVSMMFTALEGDNTSQFSSLGASNTLSDLIDSVKIDQYATPVTAAGLLLIMGIAAIPTTRQKKRLTLG